MPDRHTENVVLAHMHTAEDCEIKPESASISLSSVDHSLDHIS